MSSDPQCCTSTRKFRGDGKRTDGERKPSASRRLQGSLPALEADIISIKKTIIHFGRMNIE